MAAEESKTTIVIAIAANIAIAASKFVAASFTGSSAMLSEGIHSLVDTANGLLLLVGLRRSRKPPNEDHPFGHGKELYVWSLVVAMLIFGVGGGISAYEGVVHWSHPAPLQDVRWSYGVLSVAFLFEGTSWIFAVRRFRSVQHDRGVWGTLTNTKDPSAIAVFLEDSAALLGLLIALAGTALGQWTGSRAWDAGASIAIGLLLASVAILLINVSRDLLVGQAADPKTVASIRRIAAEDPCVREVGLPLTMYLGPDEILLNLPIAFSPDVPMAELPLAIERVERRIREQHPRIRRIFVEAEPPGIRPGTEGSAASSAMLARAPALEPH